jgi:hypothetical protein
MAIAYLAIGGPLIAALKLLSIIDAHKAFFLAAVLVAGGALFVYASSLKCPHCHARAFSRRRLALFYIPKTCANCDREFFD